MLINKDENHDRSVRVTFEDRGKKRTRSFTGVVDRIVFGAAEFQWHPDPAGPGGGASTSTVTAKGPNTLYTLPKASIIVLRGKLDRH